jgi:hypothetical protein
MTPEEWNRLAEATLRGKPVKAPPFLWTRIQATIEAQEESRAPWWLQWRWLSGMALTAVAVSFFVLKPSKDLPLESLLAGQPHVYTAIQVASTRWINPDHTAGFILEEPPWVDD